MKKEVIALLANYNQVVNDAMNGTIKTLSKAEWEKPLGGYFPSVRSLCSHIYAADFSWLKRFKNLRSFKVLDNPFFDRDNYARDELLFEEMAEYFEKRADMDKRQIAFADELSDADFGGVLKYADHHTGKTIEKNFGVCVLHYLNHDTHHRAMISVYLEMLGRDNDFASLVRMLK